MAAWNLYRYRKSDGSSKDWAVTTNPDASVSTRWGKTANRLPGTSIRFGIRKHDLERQKRNKGYVFVSKVDIDQDGNVTFPNLNQNAQISKPEVNGERDVDTDSSRSRVEALYWHIDCHAEREVCLDLGIAIRRMIGDLQAGMDNLPPVEQDWNDWQKLIDLTLEPQAFTHSGQIHKVHGMSPCLFLLALKHKAFAGVEIDIATENGREVSTDLKTEQEVLAFFGADIENIRPVAEVLGLLKPKLDLASALSGTDDCWF